MRVLTQRKLPSIDAVEQGARLPVSFAPQWLWFLAQVEGVSEAYHIQFRLRLKGDSDRTFLRRSLDRIVVRRESLRTTFAFIDEEPVQRIDSEEHSRFHLIEHDLRERGDTQAELDRLTAVEASTSTSLRRLPR